MAVTSGTGVVQGVNPNDPNSAFHPTATAPAATIPSVQGTLAAEGEKDSYTGGAWLGQMYYSRGITGTWYTPGGAPVTDSSMISRLESGGDGSSLNIPAPSSSSSPSPAAGSMTDMRNGAGIEGFESMYQGQPVHVLGGGDTEVYNSNLGAADVPGSGLQPVTNAFGVVQPEGYWSPSANVFDAYTYNYPLSEFQSLYGAQAGQVLYNEMPKNGTTDVAADNPRIGWDLGSPQDQRLNSYGSSMPGGSANNPTVIFGSGVTPTPASTSVLGFGNIPGAHNMTVQEFAGATGSGTPPTAPTGGSLDEGQYANNYLRQAVWPVSLSTGATTQGSSSPSPGGIGLGSLAGLGETDLTEMLGVPQPDVDAVLGYLGDGIKNFATGITDWATPYVDKLSTNPITGRGWLDLQPAYTSDWLPDWSSTGNFTKAQLNMTPAQAQQTLGTLGYAQWQNAKFAANNSTANERVEPIIQALPNTLNEWAESGTGWTVPLKMIAADIFEDLPLGLALGTEGKITPPSSSATTETVGDTDKALEQWSTMSTSERIASRAIARDLTADLNYNPDIGDSEPPTSAMPGKYDIISRIVNRDAAADAAMKDLQWQYGAENAGDWFDLVDESTGSTTPVQGQPPVQEPPIQGQGPGGIGLGDDFGVGTGTPKIPVQGQGYLPATVTSAPDFGDTGNIGDTEPGQGQGAPAITTSGYITTPASGTGTGTGQGTGLANLFDEAAAVVEDAAAMGILLAPSSGGSYLPEYPARMRWAAKRYTNPAGALQAVDLDEVMARLGAEDIYGDVGGGAGGDVNGLFDDYSDTSVDMDMGDTMPADISTGQGKNGGLPAGVPAGKVPMTMSPGKNNSGETRLERLNRQARERAAGSEREFMGKKIGRLAGYDVRAVDGTAIRDKLATDFIGGTNHAADPDIDKSARTLDVEQYMPQRDRVMTAIHEGWENIRMTRDGWDYKRAHDDANRVEHMFRQMFRGNVTFSMVEPLFKKAVGARNSENGVHGLYGLMSTPVIEMSEKNGKWQADTKPMEKPIGYIRVLPAHSRAGSDTRPKKIAKNNDYSEPRFSEAEAYAALQREMRRIASQFVEPVAAGGANMSTLGDGDYDIIGGAGKNAATGDNDDMAGNIQRMFPVPTGSGGYGRLGQVLRTRTLEKEFTLQPQPQQPRKQRPVFSKKFERAIVGNGYPGVDLKKYNTMPKAPKQKKAKGGRKSKWMP
jgi:hypothetical protein